MLDCNVLFLDGPNASGKTYAIEKITKELLERDSALHIECVSIKRFYTDIKTETLAKIYSYDMQWFTHDEVMYILSKHVELLDYVDARLASGEVDLMIVDRTIVSTVAYNIWISKILYSVNGCECHQEYHSSEISEYIERQIKPRLKAQNSLYVYLRFSLKSGQNYLNDALKQSIVRLEARGVKDYTLDKLTTVISVMEALHCGLAEPRQDGCMIMSPSSDVRAFFSSCMATDSYHVDSIVKYLWDND